MLQVECDHCHLQWTTKGGYHRVFYQYKLPNGKDAHVLDFLPLWVSWLNPMDLKSTSDAKYEGVKPRFATVLFGPYELEEQNKPEFWKSVLAHLNELGPELLFQMSCPHTNATTIADDSDPSHGVGSLRTRA